MRNQASLAVACLVLAFFVAACRSNSPANSSINMPQGLPSASKEQTDFFETKIHAEWQAIGKKDKKALGDLLDDDYVAVEADREGERFRYKVINEMDRSSVTDYTLSALKVSPLGPDAVFIRYEVFMRFPKGSLQPYLKVLVGEVWRRHDGQWKALHYQETAVK